MSGERYVVVAGVGAMGSAALERAQGERAQGEQLLVTTGCIDAGRPGSRVLAGRLVLAAGARMQKLGAVPAGILTPGRQVLAWFQPRRPELFTPQRCPVWILETEECRQFYGFPVHGVPGFKLGRMHHLDERIDPDDFDREPGPRGEALLRDFTEQYFPDAAGPTLALATCIFTNTPNEHFVIDLLPGDERVVVSPCSGHGFKFSSAVGEIAADLALDGASRHDIGFLHIGRFSTA